MRAELAQWEGTAAARNTGTLWNRGKADPIAEITSGSGFLPTCLGKVELCTDRANSQEK